MSICSELSENLQVNSADHLCFTLRPPLGEPDTRLTNKALYLTDSISLAPKCWEGASFQMAPSVLFFNI